jgi:hypothetical protein
MSANLQIHSQDNIQNAIDNLYAWEERLAAIELWTKQDCETAVKYWRSRLIELQYAPQ